MGSEQPTTLMTETPPSTGSGGQRTGGPPSTADSTFVALSVQCYVPSTVDCYFSLDSVSNCITISFYVCRLAHITHKPRTMLILRSGGLASHGACKQARNRQRGSLRACHSVATELLARSAWAWAATRLKACADAQRRGVSTAQRERLLRAT